MHEIYIPEKDAKVMYNTIMYNMACMDSSHPDTKV